MTITTKLDVNNRCFGLLNNKVEVFTITSIKIEIEPTAGLPTIYIEYVVESDATQYDSLCSRHVPKYTGSYQEDRLFATKEELLASL